MCTTSINFFGFLYIFEYKIVDYVINITVLIYFDYSDLRIINSEKQNDTDQKGMIDIWREIVFINYSPKSILKM